MAPSKEPKKKPPVIHMPEHEARRLNDMPFLKETSMSPKAPLSVRIAAKWCLKALNRNDKMTLADLSKILFEDRELLDPHICRRRFVGESVLRPLAEFVKAPKEELELALEAGREEQSISLKGRSVVSSRGVEAGPQKTTAAIKTIPESGVEMPKARTGRVFRLDINDPAKHRITVRPPTPADLEANKIPPHPSPEQIPVQTVSEPSFNTKTFGRLLSATLGEVGLSERVIAQNHLGISYPDYLRMTRGEALVDEAGFKKMMTALARVFVGKEQAYQIRRTQLQAALKEAHLSSGEGFSWSQSTQSARDWGR
jgi:hypothetical protein